MTCTAVGLQAIARPPFWADTRRLILNTRDNLLLLFKTGRARPPSNLTGDSGRAWIAQDGRFASRSPAPTTGRKEVL